MRVLAMAMHAAAAPRPVARQHPHVPQQLFQPPSPSAPALHAAGASNIVPGPVLAAAVAAESLAQPVVADGTPPPAAAEESPAADAPPMDDRERVRHLLLSWDRYM